MLKRLAECQRVIGYAFADPNLLEIALTHSSVRTPDRECNERQEFLGDSVLGLAITEELYKRLPDQQEGELTRIKSAVVSRGALYRVSTKLGLTRFIEVAKGVARREELPVSLTANLVESIIGAVYLDGGFYPAREFILRHLGPEIEDVFNDRVPKNFKSLLQHEAQQLLGCTPVYRSVEEEGPDHRKAFTVAAILKGTEYGRATGINKKEAEQEAARHALEALKYRGRRRRRRLPELRERDPRETRDTRDRDARDPRDRDRDRVRTIVKQSSDADDWREWAEAAAKPAGPTDYAIAPEADEGFVDDGGASRPAALTPEFDADAPRRGPDVRCAGRGIVATRGEGDAPAAGREPAEGEVTDVVGGVAGRSWPRSRSSRRRGRAARAGHRPEATRCRPKPPRPCRRKPTRRATPRRRSWTARAVLVAGRPANRAGSARAPPPWRSWSRSPSGADAAPAGTTRPRRPRIPRAAVTSR
jgi:ribonuclease-3